MLYAKSVQVLGNTREDKPFYITPSEKNGIIGDVCTFINIFSANFFF